MFLGVICNSINKIEIMRVLNGRKGASVHYERMRARGRVLMSECAQIEKC